MVRNLASAGVRVPDGFATTADAYRRFISEGGLDEMINAELAALDTENVEQLAAVGSRIREAVIRQPLPADLEADIRKAYTRLAGESGNSENGVSFAVRSECNRRRPARCLICRSAGNVSQRQRHRRHTDRDQESLRIALQRPRHRLSGLTIGSSTRRSRCRPVCQRMVRSDIGASGVMFTMDTESGFRRCGVRQRLPTGLVRPLFKAR